MRQRRLTSAPVVRAVMRHQVSKMKRWRTFKKKRKAPRKAPRKAKAKSLSSQLNLWRKKAHLKKRANRKRIQTQKLTPRSQRRRGKNLILMIKTAALPNKKSIRKARLRAERKVRRSKAPRTKIAQKKRLLMNLSRSSNLPKKSF